CASPLPVMPTVRGGGGFTEHALASSAAAYTRTKNNNKQSTADMLASTWEEALSTAWCCGCVERQQAG
ncbi:MAG: hypothetical protein ACKPKO_32775, partial [Candidatus Fonsibacter sp.]